MTEIKLTLEDPIASIRAIRYVVEEYLTQKRSEGMVGDGSMAPLLDRIADSIEEQVKPAVEEPQDFGSIVRAGSSESSDRVLWARGAGHYWFSETARRADFRDLHNPEVLRVGTDDGYRPGYDTGTKHTRERIYNRVARLKPQLITSVEQTVIDKALAEIEKDADDTVTGRGHPS